jgi:hypothetical protein
MRSMVQMIIRLCLLALFAYVCLADGFHIQIIGYIVTAWVLYRAAPGLWRDVKRLWSLGKNLSDSKISFRGGFKMKESIGL